MPDLDRAVSLTLNPDAIRWETDPDDGRGFATVLIFGVPHHLVLLPVKVETTGERAYWQVGATACADQEVDALHELYQDCAAFATVQVPGREGDFVIYLHPCED
jgi:hypothetical protein